MRSKWSLTGTLFQHQAIQPRWPLTQLQAVMIKLAGTTPIPLSSLPLLPIPRQHMYSNTVWEMDGPAHLRMRNMTYPAIHGQAPYLSPPTTVQKAMLRHRIPMNGSWSLVHVLDHIRYTALRTRSSNNTNLNYTPSTSTVLSPPWYTTTAVR